MEMGEFDGQIPAGQFHDWIASDGNRDQEPVPGNNRVCRAYYSLQGWPAMGEGGGRQRQRSNDQEAIPNAEKGYAN
jgi:hypothetical protein